MNLLKLARQTIIKVKRASVQNYQALLRANEKAQAAAIDPYDDVSPEEMNKIKDIAKSIAIVTDKAYRSGVRGAEVKYFMDKTKKQTSEILGQTKSPMVKKDLTELQTALNQVQSIDIHGQMAENTVGSTAEMPVETQEDKPTPLLTPEMEGVVNQLAHRGDPYKDYIGRPYGDKWYNR